MNNGLQTAVDQKGMTYGEYLEQYPPKSPEQKPFVRNEKDRTCRAVIQPWSREN